MPSIHQLARVSKPPILTSALLFSLCGGCLQASKLEEKVSDEIGTLRSSSHAITRQLSKQLQESQDRYIASELVVQVRDREIAQRIKVPNPETRDSPCQCPILVLMRQFLHTSG